MGFYIENAKNHSIIFLLITLLLIPGIMATGSESVPNDEQQNSRKHNAKWEYLNLWIDIDHTSDLLIGDVYPYQPGEEILTVSDGFDGGYVTMVYGNGESWKSVRIFKDDFHIKSIDIGDFYPGHPGDELAIASFSGFVTMLYFDVDKNDWYSSQIYEDYDLLHDVAVGDIDPEHPGDELVCVGESRQLSYIYYDQDTNAWLSEIIWSDEYYTSIVSLGEIYADIPGLEIAVTGGTHDVHLISGQPGDWNVEHLWHEGTFINELEIAELSGNQSSGEIYVAGFTFNVTMLALNEKGIWTSSKIWNDSTVINDLLVADHFPDHQGEELIVLNSAGDVTMLHNHQTYWHYESLYTLPKSPNKIAVGDYDGFHSGDEFAVLEFKGRLSGFALEAFDFTLLSPQDSITIMPGERIELDLLVIENGGFDELVFLNVDDVSYNSVSYLDQVDVEFETTSLTPTGFVEVALNISDSTPVSSLQVIFVGESQSSRHYFNVTLDIVNLSDLPNGYVSNGLNIDLEPRVGYIVADYSTNILINLDGYYRYTRESNSPTLKLYVGDIQSTFSIENAPLGIDLQPEVISAIGLSQSIFLITLRADTNVLPGNYFLFINSRFTVSDDDDNTFSFERVRVMQLTVEPVGTPEFFIQLSPEHDIDLLNGTEFIWTITLNTVSGFDSTVDLEVGKIDSAYEYFVSTDRYLLFILFGSSTLELSGSSLSPSKSIDMKLTAGESGTPIQSFLILKSSSNGRFKFDIVQISIVHNTTELSLSALPQSSETKIDQAVSVNITVEPVNRYKGKAELRFYNRDDNDRELEEHGREIDIDGAIAVPVIFNISKAGTYNLSVEAIVLDEVVGSTDFTIEVIKPVDIDNGDNGDKGNNDDNGDEGSQLTQDKLMVAGLIIIILLIVIVGANAVSQSRKQKKKAEKEKDEKDVEPAKPQRPRRPGRRMKIPESAEPMHKIKDGKIEHMHPKGSKEYKMGGKIFKPGGKHEFDDLDKNNK
jgi:hypothetical protein